MGFCYRLLGFRRWNVFDDEDLFSGLDQAELAAGDFFDRTGVVLEAAGFLAQARVVGPLAFDGRRQLLVLVTGPKRGEEAFFADEAVDDDGAGDDEQQNGHHTAAAHGAPGLRRLAFAGGSGVDLRHARKTVHQVVTKYKRGSVKR